MLKVENGVVSASGSMLLILSLVLGGLLGSLIGIQNGLERLGGNLEGLLKKDDSRFAEGFVSATLVTCVGSMSIVGAIQDGISGNASILYVKALLDFFTVMIFAASTGIGAVFSAIPLGIYQGVITLAATLIAPYMSDTLIAQLNMVGSVLIAGIGINLSFGEKFRIGDYLPALLIPVAYQLLSPLFQRLAALF
jgi:uncharacterized membrane protein YqgA involved in biofilm formation